jgi:hypothetical protein
MLFIPATILPQDKRDESSQTVACFLNAFVPQRRGVQCQSAGASLTWAFGE